MKITKRILMGLLICMAFLTVHSVAFAQDTVMCFGTDITRIGTTPSDLANGNTGYRFEASGGSCNIALNTPFFVSTDLGAPGLAVLLTAFSMAKPVTMRVPSPVTANSLVNTIHLDR